MNRDPVTSVLSAGLVISVGIGLVFGLWPAMKAAWLTEQAATDPRERDIRERAEKLRRDPAYARF